MPARVFGRCREVEEAEAVTEALSGHRQMHRGKAVARVARRLAHALRNQARWRADGNVGAIGHRLFPSAAKATPRKKPRAEYRRAKHGRRFCHVHEPLDSKGPFYRAGLHTSYLGEIERGLRSPALVGIVRIARGSKVVSANLFGKSLR
jgi:hypothetical protein